MSSVASPRSRPRAGTRSKTARQRSARGSLGGVIWIVVLGGLLAGVVAVNVLVLQLNLRLDGVGHERAKLKADIATTRAQLSTASSHALIRRRAATQLGLEPADPLQTTYVRLEP